MTDAERIRELKAKLAEAERTLEAIDIATKAIEIRTHGAAAAVEERIELLSWERDHLFRRVEAAERREKTLRKALARPLGQLRRMYAQLLREGIRRQPEAAKYLLGPAIEKIEAALAAERTP